MSTQGEGKKELSDGPFGFVPTGDTLGDEAVAVFGQGDVVFVVEDFEAFLLLGAADDHFAQCGGGVEDFENGAAAEMAGAQAALATLGFVNSRNFGEAELGQALGLLGVGGFGDFAMGAELAHEPLDEHNVQTGGDDIRLDAQVEQAEHAAENRRRGNGSGSQVAR